MTTQERRAWDRSTDELLARRDAMRRQYAANALGLRKMLAKAEATGKKVGGYTAEDLRRLAADYEAEACR